MKLVIMNQQEKKGERELPSQFTEPIREDLIHRAVITLQANKRQPYGAAKEAGMRASANVSKRRRKYRGSYGIGISRTPRKVMSRSGTRMNWVGAISPNTVGGRRAHPPKAEKQWEKKLNIKERRKALRSAIAATVHTELVKERGHNTPAGYPFVVDSSIEDVKKTKELKALLAKLGLKEEMSRAQVKNTRGGRGKTRGRKYIKRKGPLLVMSKKGKTMEAAKNLPGIDIIDVKSLNAELLAPGAKAGRLTLWSVAALDVMEKENLFT